MTEHETPKAKADDEFNEEIILVLNDEDGSDKRVSDPTDTEDTPDEAETVSDDDAPEHEVKPSIRNKIDNLRDVMANMDGEALDALITELDTEFNRLNAYQTQLLRDGDPGNNDLATDELRNLGIAIRAVKEQIGAVPDPESVGLDEGTLTIVVDRIALYETQIGVGEGILSKSPEFVIQIGKTVAMGLEGLDHPIDPNLIKIITFNALDNLDYDELLSISAEAEDANPDDSEENDTNDDEPIPTPNESWFRPVAAIRSIVSLGGKIDWGSLDNFAAKNTQRIAMARRNLEHVPKASLRAFNGEFFHTGVRKAIYDNDLNRYKNFIGVVVNWLQSGSISDEDKTKYSLVLREKNGKVITPQAAIQRAAERSQEDPERLKQDVITYLQNVITTHENSQNTDTTPTT